MTDLKNDITAPLRLAQGSHQKGSSYGCAMNVMSWEKGDLVITDIPDNSDEYLAVMVQHVNDGLCSHGERETVYTGKCDSCDFVETYNDAGTLIAREKQDYTHICKKLGHRENYYFVQLLCSDCAVEVLKLAHRTPGTIISDHVRRLSVWYDVVERLLKERREHYLKLIKEVDEDVAINIKALLDLVDVALEYHPLFKEQVLNVASEDYDYLDEDANLAILRKAYETALDPVRNNIHVYYEETSAIISSVLIPSWCGDASWALLYVSPGGIVETWNEWDRYGRTYANHVIDLFEEISGCRPAPEIDIDKLNEALTKMGIREPISA